MEPTLLVFIVGIAVLAVGSLIFFVWLAITTVRLTCQGCFALLKLAWNRIATELNVGPTTPKYTLADGHETIPPRAYRGRCGNGHCGAALPRSAKFCVRCGSSTMTVSRQVA